MKKNTLIKIGLVAVMPFMMSGCYMSTVDSGEAGVEVSAGSVNTTALTEGFHFSINPLADLDLYNTKVKALIMNNKTANLQDTNEIIYDSSVGILTTKSLEVPIDMVVNYSIAKSCAPTIRIAYGLDMVYDEKIIIPKVRSVARDVIGKADIYEMNKNRELYSNGIEAGLNKEFEDIFGAGCVNVTTASIQHIYIPEILKKSIMAKVQMNEEVDKTRMEIEKTVAEAEKRVARENGEADAKRVRARGVADARIIEASAIAEANDKIDASLTDKVLAYKALENEKANIDKWDGVKPRVMMSNGATPLVNIPTYKD